ncbi:transient receptor potential cation channel subfamily A member 1-like [Acanthaster planci]|uniref:Transient receptor potential cation channel subfamily A member 1-like n=1 Tax=Acanthaster planci TaxID=133434 RepID=A0A8B7Z0Z0_ACAPL|nr:transient receptor potential cation channel subfamily A member 1-like [Acanthaster planci]
MRGTRKFTERWIRVANISKEREQISLEGRGSSAGSTRSAVTLNTMVDGSTQGGRCEHGSKFGWCSPGGSSSPAEMAKLPLEDFIDTVRENSAFIHETDLKGATVLHYAAQMGRKDLVEHITLCSGDVKAQDAKGEAPLHWAVRGNSPDTVHSLMFAGADPAVLNNIKMAPLHLASDLDMPDMIEALCYHKDMDVNMPGEYGQTPLHYCAIKNAFEAAKKLMVYKPRYCKRDDNGVYVIHCAATHASRDVLNMLLEKAEEAGYPRDYVLRQKDKENNTALHSAVNSGSEEAVRVCIEFGSPLDVLQEDDSTPLHLAASQGSLPIIKLLLSPPGSEATLSMCDVEKMTPLHRAAMFDHVDVVEFLIAQGADMDAVDKNGYSPVLRAVSRGSFRSALLLNKNGADCRLRDCQNRNILHLAVLSGKDLMKCGLTALKSDIPVLLNDVDNRGCTPIHYATRDGNIKSVKSLIELGATVNLKDFKKQSPLHFAAKYGRFNSCKRLLDSSIGPNIINDIDGEGMTALHIAALNGHAKVIQLLLLRGALLHRDYKGRTPLHLAAMAGYQECMKILLTTHNYLLDQADDNGDTAVILAAKEDQPASVDFLLTYNASLAVKKDKKGLMAAAVAANNVEVAQATVAHERWTEVLRSYLIEEPEATRNLISKMPEVYKRILDRCLTRSAQPPVSADFWAKYDFTCLQPPLEERIRSRNEGSSIPPLHSLNLMVENNHMDLLSHPICVEYLNMKWRSYGVWIHTAAMAFHVIFVACMTFFIVGSSKYYDKNANQTLANTGLNATPVATSTDMQDSDENALSDWMLASAYVMVIFSIINIVKECGQIYKEPRKYFRDFINLLEWGLYGCTLVFAGPFVLGYEKCKYNDICDSQWQCGAVAAFLAWFLMLLYQQRINAVGIYVVMFQVILKTLVRVLVVFVTLIIAFSMSLHMLMQYEENHAFQTIPLAIFRVYTMMMAEIDFINSFVGPTTDNDETTMTFEHLTFAFLTLLILFLPIILMNLLIGLAVGDIAKVQQDAKLQRLAMQVEMYTDMEQKIPAKLLDWVDMDYVLIFPNKKTACQREHYGNKMWRKMKHVFFGKDSNLEQVESAMRSAGLSKGFQENGQTCNSEMDVLKNKIKSLSFQMDKQYDLLRLIVQKMEITTEADDQDEGTAPPTEHGSRLRIDMGQVVTAAAMMRDGDRERRLQLYRSHRKESSGIKPPEPSV